MAYAPIALAMLGFAIGTLFRLQVLLVVIALLVPLSVAFSIGSGLSFSDGLIMIMMVQTIVQGSYFLGLLARALSSHSQRHIL